MLYQQGNCPVYQRIVDVVNVVQHQDEWLFQARQFVNQNPHDAVAIRRLTRLQQSHRFMANVFPKCS